MDGHVGPTNLHDLKNKQTKQASKKKKKKKKKQCLKQLPITILEVLTSFKITLTYMAARVGGKVNWDIKISN